MIGQTLSHYKVLEKLGSGGMGDVYVAEDTKLSRKIALKVLPPEMASEERLMRFEREAKAVAALNHPNIVHVYSVEESEGTHFITMELVRGKTLSELIPKNGLPLIKFFEIAIPLADAVSSAHQQGIIHRDLKPDNLMVSDEGRLKILDFGLAKLKEEFAEEGLSELPTRSPTQEGRILGTVAYMSPEQAEGKQIDHRSDIFSIGIILYEMVTGQRPFKGDTTASMLSSILRDTPTSATELNPALPRDVTRIIRRCLAKDSTRRYQNALEVKNELEDLKADVASGEVLDVSARPASVSPRNWRWLAAFLMVAVIAAVLGYMLRPSRDTTPQAGVPRLTHPVQLTSSVGVEAYPTWSPDGSRIAFAAGPANMGAKDVWVTQTSGGPAVNLTADHGGDDSLPSWSPDGSQIAFVSSRDGGGCFVMPALGGPPRKMIIGGDAVGGWSANGEELACSVSTEDDFLVRISNITSGAYRDVPFPAGVGMPADLSWSPDGRFFTYIRHGSPEAPVTELWLMRVDDGEGITLTDGTTNVWGPSWSSDGGLYYVSNAAGGMDLWRQRLHPDGNPDGSPEPITVGIGMHGRAIFSPDGSRVAYSKGGLAANLWRIPILSDQQATWADAEQLTSDQAFVEYLDVSRDGRWLTFSSDRSGNHDLWVMPAEGGEIRQLTTDPTPDWAPAWSPDGTEIAFYAYRSGSRDIWVMPVEAGPARQITTDTANEYGPRWSPDGKRITFYSDGAVWTVSANGGEPQIVASDGGQPDWSPDGRWITFNKWDGDGIWRASLDGRIVEKVVSPVSTTARWAPDGKLYYLWRPNIWSISPEDGSKRQVTDFQGRNGDIGTLALATDGDYLYFTWRQDLGDIWLMDVVQE